MKFLQGKSVEKDLKSYDAQAKSLLAQTPTDKKLLMLSTTVAVTSITMVPTADASTVLPGITDGLPGLDKVFIEEFPKANVQRCQIHVARNVLAKVPNKLRKDVADDLRSIFYASSKDKATDFYKSFYEKWEKEIPSAVKSLSQSVNCCLTFFSFPKEDWISLRTTNIIERLNKEFKRRTKPMEIVVPVTDCWLLYP